MSRRRLLGRLSGAAVGGGALAATGLVGGGRASADDGDAFELGAFNSASSQTQLFSSADWALWIEGDANSAALRSRAGALGVWATTSQNGTGVKAGVFGDVSHNHLPGTGVIGAGPTGHAEGIGVEGLGYQGTGVRGVVSDTGHGVLGQAGAGFGVMGEASSPSGVGVGGTAVSGGTGVRGTVPNGGHGVLGRAGFGFGVKGEATAASGVGVGGVGADGGTAIRGTVPDQGYAVRGVAGSGFGVLGEVANGVAVSGESSSNGWGVRGRGLNGGWGVQGISDSSIGVRGDSTGGTGVRGESQTATGVYGRSVQHTGVTGYGGTFGVVGQCDAGGTAVDATSSNGGTGVWGRSLPTGYGLRGESTSGFGVWGSSPQGTAVSGIGRLGGEFRGTRAAVRLVPTAFAGSPPTGRHLRGDLVCDKNGDLWFCKADGTPGTWVQIA